MSQKGVQKVHMNRIQHKYKLSEMNQKAIEEMNILLQNKEKMMKIQNETIINLQKQLKTQQIYIQSKNRQKVNYMRKMEHKCLQLQNQIKNNDNFKTHYSDNNKSMKNKIELEETQANFDQFVNTQQIATKLTQISTNNRQIQQSYMNLYNQIKIKQRDKQKMIEQLQSRNNELVRQLNEIKRSKQVIKQNEKRDYIMRLQNQLREMKKIYKKSQQKMEQERHRYGHRQSIMNFIMKQIELRNGKNINQREQRQDSQLERVKEWLLRVKQIENRNKRIEGMYKQMETYIRELENKRNNQLMKYNSMQKEIVNQRILIDKLRAQIIMKQDEEEFRNTEFKDQQMNQNNNVSRSHGSIGNGKRMSNHNKMNIMKTVKNNKQRIIQNTIQNPYIKNRRKNSIMYQEYGSEQIQKFKERIMELQQAKQRQDSMQRSNERMIEGLRDEILQMKWQLGKTHSSYGSVFQSKEDRVNQSNKNHSRNKIGRKQRNSEKLENRMDCHQYSVNENYINKNQQNKMKKLYHNKNNSISGNYGIQNMKLQRYERNIIQDRKYDIKEREKNIELNDTEELLNKYRMDAQCRKSNEGMKKNKIKYYNRNNVMENNIDQIKINQNVSNNRKNNTDRIGFFEDFKTQKNTKNNTDRMQFYQNGKSKNIIIQNQQDIRQNASNIRKQDKYRDYNVYTDQKMQEYNAQQYTEQYDYNEQPYYKQKNIRQVNEMSQQNKWEQKNYKYNKPTLQQISEYGRYRMITTNDIDQFIKINRCYNHLYQ